MRHAAAAAAVGLLLLALGCCAAEDPSATTGPLDSSSQQRPQQTSTSASANGTHPHSITLPQHTPQHTDSTSTSKQRALKQHRQEQRPHDHHPHQHPNHQQQQQSPDSARSLRGLAARTRARLAYVLLGSGTRNDLLYAALKQLRDHLLPWTPGDVLFYHTGEYESLEQQSEITRIIPSVFITRIPAEAWVLPAGMTEADAPNWKYSKCCPFPMHGIGYRHMCRWYSNGLFKQLDVFGYKWVFRLDEDSEVLSDVKQNMVSWMEVHNKRYGFRLWDEEGPEMIWALPELTAWYLTAKEIRPRWLYDSCRPRSSSGLNSYGGWNRRIIYNNMFMTNITWWLTPEVQSYLTTVEESKGHYLYRWGDAPIHTMVVRTFLSRREVHMFGFSYCHKGNCDPQRAYHNPALHELPP